ncbi:MULTISPECIES: phytanoyl-CoA dioxygenase family protein [unclassified Pedobacter]|uniref:phytanoyl-CoA dioxygenase family protein n=1 Tax=unclassified Pedobacter TaxID=2628915 RepID=UPI00141EFA76|nr:MULTISPECIES: phytanoyl-CoA dioxygenase family protein [unclassified Pedobacter]NII85103.1 ectoine hydroxylase-related dioxygenase (phytanoyl-CoA dioxygenase family) [Pedobacter sp. SG908]NMN37989.1 ectoine hydroxylase-related dioxygenase (phytanoyl-CoA dioxygenase family) [Pedobacter sp. SG918]
MDLGVKEREIRELGFSVVDDVFTDQEIEDILAAINRADSTKETFRKSDDLFAIRQFLKEVPETIDLIFNHKLKHILKEVFGEDYFLVKSIYFDKPETSNWFVSYHQDLTISVNQKVEIAGFGPYTNKHKQFAVQPPLDILESNFTIRIHLDDTNEENGALKVIANSHRKSIYRPETINWNVEKEISCNIKRGGVMIMKPLLLHSSGRTTNNQKRRVIHLEFSNKILPKELKWSEYLSLT